MPDQSPPQATLQSSVNAVDAAIRSRRSVREFLPAPIAVSVVMEILDVASRAPSGHNTQPWAVHLLTEDAVGSLSREILKALDEPDSFEKHRPVFDAYPAEWISPYIDRRRQAGKALYSMLQIPKGDKEAMQAQTRKNYTFFGAPVGLMFTLHKLMVPGSLVDLGMYLQNVVTAARARGIDTCVQAAFATVHKIVRQKLSFDADHVLICGMSMGYADVTAPVNQVQTEREAAQAFVTVHHR